MSYIEYTAKNSGYYRVFVDGVQVSQHLQEREAAESASKQKRNSPDKAVHYDHDYHVEVSLLPGREPPPVVVPPPPAEPEDPKPPVDPPVEHIAVSDFELVGGWIMPQDFPKGGLAIDFERGRIYSGGHATRSEIQEYELPAELGTGDKVADWPMLKKVATHSKYWGRGDAGGLEIRDGYLWVSARHGYDTQPQNLTLYGKHLETGEIATVETPLSQPGFGGGFIKGRGDWLLGCGGYESGQGSKSGPTLAKPDGTILLDQANHGTMDWDARTPRPANYFAPSDSWIALNPRNGEGRWACDRIYGGGVWHQRGLMFWALMGTGELLYKRQNETFGKNAENQIWLYTYDPKTFELIGFEQWPTEMIIGHDVGPDGLIYIVERKAFRKSGTQIWPVIRAYRIKE